MSVGNLKTYGGKGTNMPWQLKMLFGQECACDNLAQIVSNTSAVSRTPNYIRISTSGTIADVTYSFSIANVGTANGTFLGATIKPGESVSFGADGINNSYAASTFTFDGTGTELLITYNS